ncbi:TatD family nuclease-associated radical SAM protein [Candidatus Bathyarchaeota archaeon]|nr:TatD family nuclease-associated radical SAM protein [Candidatus Bathyarchaeota archaeon]
MPAIVYWSEDNLYLNITNRCSNNCYFCFRNFISGVWGFNLKLRKEPTPNEIIKNLQRVINQRHWKEVIFCGFGEPTERLDCLLDVTKWIKNYHKSLVRLNTNGQAYLLNPGRSVINELEETGLDKVSISLNAHNKEVYNKISNPKFENTFESVLGFIEESKRNLDTEITVVTIPEADIKKIKKIVGEEVKFRKRIYEPHF